MLFPLGSSAAWTAPRRAVLRPYSSVSFVVRAFVLPFDSHAKCDTRHGLSPLPGLL